MTGPSASLESLRRDIDAIDDEIHDLLMRRTEVVERIGALKNQTESDVFIRPAREAEIMRRLIDRHRGRFPASVVVRLWREVLAATSRLQGPFSVAVHAPEKSVGYWDLARDHFGSGTKMTLHRLSAPVIRAVVDGTATVGVLPFPQSDDGDPWWPSLIATGERMPRVIARLPFIDNDDGRFEPVNALAIARTDPGETGNDVSLVAVEASAGISRASLKQAFDSADVPANDIAVWRESDTAGARFHLIEVADYVTPDDPRLDAVAEDAGDQIVRVIGLGGYAAPLARPIGGG